MLNKNDKLGFLAMFLILKEKLSVFHYQGWFLLWIFSTVHPWYPWLCGSKETTMEEKPQMLRMGRVQCCTADDSFFP
jgi:hypothetical protein